ncbi:hypothetical protein OUZ56_019333 [Daphnia magna]|uniref:Uncharacterized protein n=1 Tax=Daphnia magna TaxID=35525 RepID=A0ABQ9ZBA6_9CRUS|nr:hypothetical protein OUZ56_019333 [Daphnia magna]
MDIESCILCWAPMSRETAPQTDQRRKSSQQRFPVESFSSHIQTGVEELHIIVACAFLKKEKRNNPCNFRISISCLRQSLVCTSVHQDSAPFAFSFNGLIILPHLHNMAGRPRWQGKRVAGHSIETSRSCIPTIAVKDVFIFSWRRSKETPDDSQPEKMPTYAISNKQTNDTHKERQHTFIEFLS